MSRKWMPGITSPNGPVVRVVRPGCGQRVRNTPTGSFLVEAASPAIGGPELSRAAAGPPQKPARPGGCRHPRREALIRCLTRSAAASLQRVSGDTVMAGDVIASLALIGEA